MPRHVVVDGSNLATEGRSMPSLQQLNDAVNAFIAENPTDLVTVVVDATFGHRIDPKEVPDFEEAIEHNELVAPPAGAVGRGDAFVLSIANKVGAVILSNDSFQEFHPDYPWLFDEGRLVGGKPVPHVGWVFVARTPVRGPVSRRATREKKIKAAGGEVRVGAKASKAASQPMPVPKAPPPGAVLPDRSESGRSESGRGRGRRGGRGGAPETATPVVVEAAAAAKPAAPSAHVNALMPFITFVEKHPVGTSVNAIVESYSSHGAYVTIGDVRGYVPLRLMAEPPPRSAREQMKIGESVTLVVVSFAASRRSIDLAVPHLSDAAIAAAAAETATDEPAPKQSTRSSRGRRSAATVETPADVATVDTPAPVKKAAAKKAAPVEKAAPVKKAAPAKKAAATKAAPAKKAATADAAAPVKETAAKKAAPAKKATPAKKAAPTEKVAPVKKAAAKKAAPAEKVAPVKKAAAKKAAPAETAVPAKKAAAKKAAAKKAALATKAAPAKKAATKKAAG